MSGCSWSWPYWKFGLKKDDLTTSLHDRYNTVTIPILDPEAFHHDVCEIAHLATSPEEFLGMLEKRKEQRLQELNEILESAALEIIANPTFIGNEQWQPAIQLFRTRSFDSLVRFFASYLPADHPWYKPAQPKSGTCYQDSSSGSFDGSSGTVFDEPESMSDSTDTSSHETLSSKAYYSDSHRSMTMCSDSSVASPSDNFHDYDDSRPSTPGRAYSFSESEPDCCPSGTGECNCREQFSSPGLTSNPGQYTPGTAPKPAPPKPTSPSSSASMGENTTEQSTSQRRHPNLSSSRAPQSPSDRSAYSRPSTTESNREARVTNKQREHSPAKRAKSPSKSAAQSRRERRMSPPAEAASRISKQQKPKVIASEVRSIQSRRKSLVTAKPVSSIPSIKKSCSLG